MPRIHKSQHEEVLTGLIWCHLDVKISINSNKEWPWVKYKSILSCWYNGIDEYTKTGGEERTLTGCRKPLINV